MARKATLPFIQRQVMVSRLVVALRNLGHNVGLDELEMAYSDVPVTFAAESKAELKAKLDANQARIAELEAALAKAKVA